jgi:3-hydroxy-9,10-secoandrosta-1,3,5(10)-triene-9,17-dione monooxygenase reductase component
MPHIDTQIFRQTMGQFCTGVVAVTGCLDGQPLGFAAQSFVSLSLDPPLVAVCPAKTSTSWPGIRDSGSFAINILAADQRPVCDVLARSGGDKFAALGWRAGETGSPILEGIIAWVECRIEAEHEAGDHTIAVGRVVGLERCSEAGPLLFYAGKYGEFSRRD